MGVPYSSETEEKPLPEVVNEDDFDTAGSGVFTDTSDGKGAPAKQGRNKREHGPREFFEQKKFLSQPFLPTEVC